MEILLGMGCPAIDCNENLRHAFRIKRGPKFVNQNGHGIIKTKGPYNLILSSPFRAPSPPALLPGSTGDPSGPSALRGPVAGFPMTNDKSSMTNSQFGLSHLVAALWYCALAPLAACVGTIRVNPSGLEAASICGQTHVPAPFAPSCGHPNFSISEFQFSAFGFASPVVFPPISAFSFQRFGFCLQISPLTIPPLSSKLNK